jgi:hypothetical protein
VVQLFFKRASFDVKDGEFKSGNVGNTNLGKGIPVSLENLS